MTNEQIRDKGVRLIGEDGEQLDIVPRKEALRLTQETELDLMKTAPTARPPICKIIGYGKHRYELARKKKEVRKKQKVIGIRETHLSSNTDTNDLNTKVGTVRKFLEKDDKVKVALRSRGHKVAHTFKSKYILNDSVESLKGIAATDRPSKVRGRSVVMSLTAKR